MAKDPSTWQKIQKIYHKTYLFFLFMGFAFFLFMLTLQNGKQPKTANTLETTPVNALENRRCLVTNPTLVETPDKSDFKTLWEISTISIESEIYKSNLTKNEVPALTKPQFIAYQPDSICYLADDEVLVLEVEGQYRAYPKFLLQYHFAINDTVNGLPLLITYSPFSGFYQVFRREYQKEVLSFGVSGMLYKNNDLLFDFKTDSLWTQLEGKAVVGLLTGGKLNSYPFTITTYSHLAAFPSIKVLSTETGYLRNYAYNPFAEFEKNEQIVGIRINRSNKLPLKEELLTVIKDDKAYALQLAKLANNTTYTTDVAGVSWTFSKDEKGQWQLSSPYAQKPQLFTAYWYVWYDFYPETELL